MRVIISDLDGTLLRQDKSISARTLNVLEKIKKKGFIFAAATARPKRSVDELLPSKLTETYLICYNGAEIYHGEQLIYSKYLDTFAVKDTVQWLITNYPGMKISIEINNQLYSNFDISIMSGWNVQFTLVDFYDFEYKPAAKILVDLSETDDISKIINFLPENFNMVITDKGTLGHIAHKEVSKMNAIRALSKIVGFNNYDVIAFGDDFNDYDMIRESGIGVAMGNAPEEIKQIAKIVAETNDNDGVAIELEKLLQAVN